MQYFTVGDAINNIEYVRYFIAGNASEQINTKQNVLSLENQFGISLEVIFCLKSIRYFIDNKILFMESQPSKTPTDVLSQNSTACMVELLDCVSIGRFLRVQAGQFICYSTDSFSRENSCSDLVVQQ